MCIFAYSRLKSAAMIFKQSIKSLSFSLTIDCVIFKISISAESASDYKRYLFRYSAIINYIRKHATGYAMNVTGRAYIRDCQNRGTLAVKSYRISCRIFSMFITNYPRTSDASNNVFSYKIKL